MIPYIISGILLVIGIGLLLLSMATSTSTSTSTSATPSSPSNSGWWGMAIAAVVLAVIVGGIIAGILLWENPGGVLDAGWHKSEVDLIPGPKGKHIIQIDIPGSAGKIVKFKKYRWTISYLIASSGEAPKICAQLAQPQNKMQMGKFPTALMSGDNPPPDIVWWKILKE